MLLSSNINNKKSNTNKKSGIAYGAQNTILAILELISQSKSEVLVCGNYIMQAMEGEVLKSTIKDARNRGVRLKCLIEITHKNIDYCKILMKLFEVRHIDDLKANFIITESKCLSISTITALQERKTVPRYTILHIDIAQIVEQYRQIFDTLWNKTTAAHERIRQIQEGYVKPFGINIILDRKRIESLFLSEIHSARSEVIIAVSSVMYLKHLSETGLVDSIKQVKSNRANIVNIMILYSEEFNNAYTSSKIISDLKRYAQVKSISGIQGMVLLIDNSKVLTIIENRTLNTIAVYSDNKSLVKNFGSLLDSLWNETEMLDSIIAVKDDLANLNEKLVEANDQLKIHDKMQREFINIAAHELRTPIMPILGYAELLEDIEEKEEGAAEITTGKKDKNIKRNYLRYIIKNAEKLQQLSETILDITKIESRTLNLVKTHLNIEDVILSAMDDMQINISKDPVKKNSIKLRYEPSDDDRNVLIEADRSRLTQVISNLLRNAIKFTNEGHITVRTEKKEDAILVHVKDTGSGIDPEIMSRLFTKFTTASFQGTGLGLYISKSIVEAHGGTIWAENNKDSEKRGATFTFSLPLTK